MGSESYCANKVRLHASILPFPLLLHALIYLQSCTFPLVIRHVDGKQGERSPLSPNPPCSCRGFVIVFYGSSSVDVLGYRAGGRCRSTRVGIRRRGEE